MYPMYYQFNSVLSNVCQYSNAGATLNLPLAKLNSLRRDKLYINFDSFKDNGLPRLK